MKVKELIEILQKLDPDMNVYGQEPDGGDFEIDIVNVTEAYISSLDCSTIGVVLEKR